MNPDCSNGYEAVAETFIRVRSQQTGVATVRDWARAFQPGDEILDIGAGSGEPLTTLLAGLDLDVYAIDASRKMVAAFRKNLPNVKIACEAVEQSVFFNRKFEGVLAIGLVFLLEPAAQRQLIPRLAKALKPGGHLLFSAPKEIGNWVDVLTKHKSYSLGETAYHELLIAAGLRVSGSYMDEGGSHYYAATKPK